MKRNFGGGGVRTLGVHHWVLQDCMVGGYHHNVIKIKDPTVISYTKIRSTKIMIPFCRINQYKLVDY